MGMWARKKAMGDGDKGDALAAGRGPRIFLFFARSSAMFGNVISVSSREDWVSGARAKFGLPDAEVILIQEGEWEAPRLPSIDPDSLRASFPALKAGIKKVLSRQGVSGAEADQLTENIAVTKNPMTGLAVFSIVVRA
jgi:hypothetical protein